LGRLSNDSGDARDSESVGKMGGESEVRGVKLGVQKKLSQTETGQRERRAPAKTTSKSTRNSAPEEKGGLFKGLRYKEALKVLL